MNERCLSLAIGSMVAIILANVAKTIAAMEIEDCPTIAANAAAAKAEMGSVLKQIEAERSVGGVQLSVAEKSRRENILRKGADALQLQQKCILLQADKTIEEYILSTISAPLRSFQLESKGSCESEALHAASSAAIDAVSSLESDTQFRYVIARGAALLDVADAARIRGCSETAEHLYDMVIQVYIGQTYEALRQRAQLGILRLHQ